MALLVVFRGEAESFISCYMKARAPLPLPSAQIVPPPLRQLSCFLSPVMSGLVWRCNVRGFEMTKISNINNFL